MDKQDDELTETHKIEVHTVESEPEVITEKPQEIITEPTPAEPKPSGSSAGLIILQWLTYAFWGWTILALVWLVFVVLLSMMFQQAIEYMTPYAIAATIVLLPISAICDFVYGRHEPAKKTGAAMVVMVIHAVIFALFGIGALISGVLTVVQSIISPVSGPAHDAQMVWILTSFIAAAIYGFTFLRTLNPSPKLKLQAIYPATMLVFVSLFIVLGFIGPVALVGSTRDDRAIEGSLSEVHYAVGSYIQDNRKLPGSLSDVPLTGDAKDIVDRKLVTYKAVSSPSPTLKSLTNNQSNKGVSIDDSFGKEQKYRYQLCVTYKAKGQYSDYAYDTAKSSSEYSESVDTYNHPAGNVCYKLSKTAY